MAIPAPAKADELTRALADDRARALALVPVDTKVAVRLDRFVALLLEWQALHNLISASSVASLWTRHVADSLQLLALLPAAARTIVDLGSGAGFPGLVLAIALAERPGVSVHLVESHQRKSAFLRAAAAETGAPAIVLAERAEAVLGGLAGSADVVTARALAPLTDLLALTFPLLKTGALGVFPKGRSAEAELTEAAKTWTLQLDLLPSLTDPDGRVLRIRHAEKMVPRRSSRLSP